MGSGGDDHHEGHQQVQDDEGPDGDDDENCENVEIMIVIVRTNFQHIWECKTSDICVDNFTC